MKETCRAAVLYGPGDLRLEEVPIPQIDPEEVLIRVKACSLCGSDLHAYASTHPRVTFPRILGHEIGGIIYKKGGKVSGWEIGQRVCCDVGYLAKHVTCAARQKKYLPQPQIHRVQR